MSKIVAVIETNETGELVTMATDAIDLSRFGRTVKVDRLSNVEFDLTDQKWVARPTPIGAAMLQETCSRNRGECIASEIKQILSHAARRGYNLIANK